MENYNKIILLLFNQYDIYLNYNYVTVSVGDVQIKKIKYYLP